MSLLERLDALHHKIADLTRERDEARAQVAELTGECEARHDWEQKAKDQIAHLTRERDAALRAYADVAPENARLLALLREVADVVANCCNCINLYDDGDEPRRLIDRVNAALEGRDADPLP